MANILVVDDHEDLLELLSTVLKKQGYNVEAALSHEKAKNALSVFVPDVMLLDVRINGADGRELCKEIREKHNHHIPIILLSASPDLLKKYGACNAEALIEKPFDLTALIEKIDDVLKEYKKRA